MSVSIQRDFIPDYIARKSNLLMRFWLLAGKPLLLVK
jgi:hypothetical protein